MVFEQNQGDGYLEPGACVDCGQANAQSESQATKEKEQKQIDIWRVRQMALGPDGG